MAKEPLFNRIFGQAGGGVGGLLGNPAFMIGAGLLGNQQNQMGGALSGLAAAQGYKLSEAKMKKDEEREARQAELQAMQMKAMQDAQARQQYTQSLLAAGSSQNPALLQDPAFQSQLRMKAAAYGDPAMLQAGGLLQVPQEPTKPTSAMQNLAAMGLQPGTPEYESMMRDYMVKPRSTVNVNTGAALPYKLPADHMLVDPSDPSKGVMPIPGSETAKKAAAEASQATEGAAARVGKIDTVMGEVDRAIESVGITTAGLLGSVAKDIPATSAKDLSGALTTIKANIGFDALQAMREASPTGGALGQVAVQELESLQASVASLDQAQSPAPLAANLKKVRDHYANWRATVEQAKSGQDGGIVPNSSPAQRRGGQGRVVDFNSL